MAEHTIKPVSIDALRRMADSEGLIIQVRSGDLQECADRISDLLTEKQILQDGDTFKEVYVFEHGGKTNLLFCFDDVALQVGLLGMWMQRTRKQFHGAYLTEFVEDELGGYANARQVRVRPPCPVGPGVGIYGWLELASETLTKSGMPEAAEEMRSRFAKMKRNQERLVLISEYVTAVAPDEVAEDCPVIHTSAIEAARASLSKQEMGCGF